MHIVLKDPDSRKSYQFIIWMGIVLIFSVRLNDHKMLGILEALEKHIYSRGQEINPMKIRVCFVSYIYRAGFPSGGTVDILGQEILLWGAFLWNIGLSSTLCSRHQ